MSSTTTLEKQSHAATITLSFPEQTASTRPAISGLWKWTFQHEAIAPCFIIDIFNMTESVDKQFDFFWLGRVPCRTVRILGLVVGVQIYEKRIRYTVDDGTSVIDCLHRPPAPPKIPTKKTQSKPGAPSPPLVLDPVAHVGSPACVIGRVVRKYETREIVVDNITRCASFNDEPKHWREVCALHKSHYDISTPFVLSGSSKESIMRPSSLAKIPPETPKKTPQAPTPQPSTPSTVYSTPVSSSVASSPVKSVTQSPQKLRHPSRLHSRELTANAFRIYVKYYMDHATQPSMAESIEIDPDPEMEHELHPPFTPTKRTASRFGADETPRPRIPRNNASIALRTHPPIPPLSFDSHKKPHRPSPVIVDSQHHGFTLSYLRRVPVLAEMAERVAKAERKRRVREERKKAKELGIANSHPSVKGTTPESALKTDGQLSQQVKQLFQWAVVRLLQDGSIFLWDGPVRPLLRPQSEDLESYFWTANASSSAKPGADSTIFSGVSQLRGEQEEVVISGPEDGEESFIPMSPKYLADFVEAAIRAINKRYEDPRKRGQVDKGATKEAVLTYLKKDDRWKYVGEWNLIEALEVLRIEKRAWCVGKGQWELSL